MKILQEHLESRFFLSEGPEGTPIWHEPPRCCFLIVKSTILYRHNHRALLFSEKSPKIHENQPGMARPNTQRLPKVCRRSAQGLPKVYRNSPRPLPLPPATAPPTKPTTHTEPTASRAPQSVSAHFALSNHCRRLLSAKCSFFREKKNCLQSFFLPDRGDYRSRKW